MPKQIRWSLLSELDFSNILEYLEIEWGKAVVNKYIDRMEDSLNQIRNNPRQYPLINKKKKIRKCVITKHNSLYYRTNKDYIDLLRIYSNFKDPKKLKL